MITSIITISIMLIYLLPILWRLGKVVSDLGYSLDPTVLTMMFFLFFSMIFTSYLLHSLMFFNHSLNVEIDINFDYGYFGIIFSVNFGAIQNVAFRVLYLSIFLVICIFFMAAYILRRFSITVNGLDYKEIATAYRLLIHLDQGYLDMGDVKNLGMVERVLRLLDLNLYSSFEKIVNRLPRTKTDIKSKAQKTETIFILSSIILTFFLYMFFVGLLESPLVFNNSVWSLRYFLVFYLLPTIILSICLVYLLFLILGIWFRFRNKKVFILETPNGGYISLLRDFEEAVKKNLTSDISMDFLIGSEDGSFRVQRIFWKPLQKRKHSLKAYLRDYAIFFVLLILLFVAIFPYDYYGSKHKISENKLRTITIDGDSELLAFAQKHNFVGNGSSSNPIIIRNLGAIAQQIKIHNTHLHVIIEDSILEMPRNTELSYDIYIAKCSNIQIRNLAILNSDSFAIRVEGSKNIIIDNISVYPKHCLFSDIYIYGSDGVEIRNFGSYNSTKKLGIVVGGSNKIYIHDVRMYRLSVWGSFGVEAKNFLASYMIVSESNVINITNFRSYFTNLSEECPSLYVEYFFMNNIYISDSKDVWISNAFLVRPATLYNIYLDGCIEQLALINITMFGGGVTLSGDTRLNGINVVDVKLNSKNVEFVVNQDSKYYSGSSSQLIVYNSTNITINEDIGYSKAAITILYSSDITITKTNISAYIGIRITQSRYVSILYSFINATKQSLYINNSNFTRIIKCSLMGDVDVLGKTADNWNITAVSTRIYSRYLSFVVNKKDVSLGGNLNYTIIFNSTDISIMHANLGANIRLKIMSASNIKIYDLEANNTTIKLKEIKNITFASIYAKGVKISARSVDNIIMRNISLVSSSISIDASKNIVLQEVYVTNTDIPFSIEESKNIKLTKIRVTNSSQAIYVASVNNITITSGVLNTSGKAIDIWSSKNIRISNIVVYGKPRKVGLILHYSENVSIKNVALFNVTFHVIGYSYSEYYGYSPQIGYTYSVVLEWDAKYYNLDIKNLTVNSLPVLYGYNLTNTVIDKPYGEIILINSGNIQIKNQHIRNTVYGIYTLLSENISIINSLFEDTINGIVILGSDQITIEKNIIRNTSSYAIYILKSAGTKIRYNSFINTNKSIYYSDAHVEISYNYWYDQTHVDKDNDGVNDYRYHNIDPNPLYRPNSEPRSIIIACFSTKTTYYALVMIIILFFIRKKLPKILNSIVATTITINECYGKTRQDQVGSH